MTCTKPFKKNGVTFGCGQCMPCRINRSRLWTARILLEQRLHDHSCFVTLTYDDAHLPPGGTLVRRHTQLFLKRLRKRLRPRRIRYFGVGEYGDDSQRPHYHICLFGVHMLEDDAVRKAWISETGEPLGFIKMDELNSGTAGYVAQYVCKKWTNDKDLYVKGHLAGRYKEFSFMSLKPGIAAEAAPIIADAIQGKAVDIPTQLRVDGVMRPLGRYVKSKIVKEFPNAEEISRYEKEVWLHSVYEELVQEKEEAAKAGKTLEEFRWEKRRQKFLNLVGKHKIHKQKRSL